MRSRVPEKSLTISTVVEELHSLFIMLVGPDTRTLKLKTKLYERQRVGALWTYVIIRPTTGWKR